MYVLQSWVPIRQTSSMTQARFERLTSKIREEHINCVQYCWLCIGYSPKEIQAYHKQEEFLRRLNEIEEPVHLITPSIMPRKYGPATLMVTGNAIVVRKEGSSFKMETPLVRSFLLSGSRLIYLTKESNLFEISLPKLGGGNLMSELNFNSLESKPVKTGVKSFFVEKRSKHLYTLDKENNFYRGNNFLVQIPVEVDDNGQQSVWVTITRNNQLIALNHMWKFKSIFQVIDLKSKKTALRIENQDQKDGFNSSALKIAYLGRLTLVCFLTTDKGFVVYATKGSHSRKVASLRLQFSSPYDERQFKVVQGKKNVELFLLNFRPMPMTGMSI
jgi:hypothetical protein